MFRRLSAAPFRFAVLAASGTALCAAAALLSPTPAVAQEGEEPAEVFIDRVMVDVVDLEVVVTDGDGNPIRGLTREDFRVLEDGDPVELTNFYAVEGGARRDLAADEPSDFPLLDLGEEEAAAEAVLPVEQRLNLAVVIDNGNIDPPSRKRILDQLREHLYSVLRPGDRVMLASLEPDLDVRLGFTDDRAAIDGGIDEIGRTVGGRADLFAQRRMIQQAIWSRDGATGGGGGGDGLLTKDTPEQAADRVLQLIQSYAQQAEAVQRNTFSSLDTLIASLAGLPGRRAVLLVSEHLTTNPAQGLFEEWHNAFAQAVPGLTEPLSEARRYDVGEHLRRVAHQAAADRVTFYTLHAGGSFTQGADQAGFASTGFAIGGQEPLMHLAAATGGSAMLNSANAEALIEQLSADYRDYYSLGYTSPKSQDGRYHRIEVRVPGRKVQVRHTEGYRAKTAEQRMKERTLSALIFDVADNPLDVRVQLLPEQEDKRHYVLPVMVRVPISRLVLLPQENVHVAKLTIVVAVRDSEGGLSNPQRVEVPVEIPNDKLLEAMGQDIGHGLNLLVRKGDAKLAVGVRDELSAVESTLNLNVTVGEG